MSSPSDLDNRVGVESRDAAVGIRHSPDGLKVGCTSNASLRGAELNRRISEVSVVVDSTYQEVSDRMRGLVDSNNLSQSVVSYKMPNVCFRRRHSHTYLDLH